MAIYDWRTFRGQNWRLRYPDDVRGARQWRESPPALTVETLKHLYVRLRALDTSPPAQPLTCPCVFISHRQVDDTYGRQAAGLAAQAGFDFWLDVLDPDLQLANSQPDVDLLLIACIIETALLNSTHVLALMTPNTPGSWWVPYEYGRVKPVGAEPVAACWRHPASRRQPVVPEYLQLGPVLDRSGHVDGWLRHEKMRLATLFPSCGGVRHPDGVIPGGLPDAVDAPDQE